MVFLYFGPTPDSWAVGNHQSSFARNLPEPLQQLWQSLGDIRADDKQAGTLISWISTSPDGSYAVMTTRGELLSNRQDLLVAAQPPSSVEHVAFSPEGGWFLRFADSSIQISSRKSFSRAFRDIADDYLDMYSSSRQSGRKVRSVLFGSNGGFILSKDKGVKYDLLSDAVKSHLRRLKSNGDSLGRASTLCPWNRDYYFLEITSTLGPPRYIYDLPPNISPNLIRGLIGESESREILSRGAETRGMLGDIFEQSGFMQSLKNNLPLPPSLPSLPTAQIPPQTRARYQKVFYEHNEGKPHLTGMEASDIFRQSGLSTAELSRIWEQSDLNRDGRFDMDEFIQAMWLIELHSNNSLQPASAPATPAQPQSRPTSYHSTVSPTPYFPPPPTSSFQPASHQQPQSLQQSLYPCSQGFQEPPPSYTVVSPPPPLLHWQYQPGLSTHGTIPPPPPNSWHNEPPTEMPMSKSMICGGCEVGILPNDIVHHCQTCNEDGLTYCDACGDSGKTCKHGMERVQVTPDKNLPVRDKDGTFGIGLWCDKCNGRMKKGDLCWYCKRCLGPDYCGKCWKKKDKRCKHAAKGKIKLCMVNKKRDDDTEEILDYIGDIAEALGG